MASHGGWDSSYCPTHDALVLHTPLSEESITFSAAQVACKWKLESRGIPGSLHAEAFYTGPPVTD